MPVLINTIGKTHATLVQNRRTMALATALVPLVPAGSSVIDVGCGDGSLGALLADYTRLSEIQGYEIAPRNETHIPVHTFDGHTLPLADGSIDVVLMVDVLHHTEDPMVLLGEGARVARHAVLLKDHRLSRPLAAPVLRFMDWVGNRPHDVVLPYNYWSMARWRRAWSELDLVVDHLQTRLGLYPWPTSWLFESGLHFLAKLKRRPAP